MPPITILRMAIALLTTVMACIPIRAQSDNEPVTIRVLTYNIYHGETMKGDFDLDLIANTIKSVDPDFVALQEVDVRTDRAKKMDIGLELALRTGLIPVFGATMPFSNGHFGNGILSKYPVIKSHNHKLPSSEDHEPRGVAEVWVSLKTKDTIRFASTHLDNLDENTDRVDQARAINRLFASKGNKTPTILAGDLNALPNSKTMKEFYRYWEKSCKENTPTAPSKDPKSKIDYILYSPENRWKVLKSEVVQEPLGSDHLPVLSILQLIP